ncbi:MAG: FliA/WhiG family RNA polymerase sigma factor [Syntrophales bacterium LBB04]|nr:FliA/WhiG family RNA polymerase sigma factor [Syntrophales bacterium LBB04]
MDKKKYDELVMKYAPLVKNIVLRMASKFPINMADKEDLINVGIIGLMSALEKYDATRNVQFETYARFRIRGAVLDELRERDWVPRSTRNKDSRLEEAFAVLQRQLGRPPDEQEMSQHLGVTLDEYYAILDEVKSISIISKEDLPTEYFEKYECEEVMGAIDSGNPLSYITNRDMINGLKKAIEALPEKEKLVLSMYYFEELTMKEIGKVIDLTESRVCQLHAQATLRLRGAVKDLR